LEPQAAKKTALAATQKTVRIAFIVVTLVMKNKTQIGNFA
jgi:hypothetical protein